MVRFGSKIVYPTDPEDEWGNIHMVGNAELAVRLGSPVMYDRGGNVIFYDDFESDAIKWMNIDQGVPARVVHSAARCYTGSSSLKLTTGVVPVEPSGIQKEFLPAYDSRLGFECMIHPVDYRIIITMEIYGYTGTENYMSRLRFYPLNHRLQYYKGGTGWVVLATDIRDGTEWENWIPIKMCIDHKTKKWIKILLGNNVYDISTSDIEVSVDTVTLPLFNIKILLHTQEASAKVIHVDNVVVTQNEML